MKRLLIRWSLIVAATFIVGPVLAALTGVVGDPHGGSEATAFLSASPVIGGALAIVVIALAGALALGAARVTTAGLGLFCAGAAIGWCAYTGATVEGVLRWSRSGSILYTLAIEGFVLGAAAIGATWAVFRFGQREPVDSDNALSPATAIGAGASLVVAVVCAWALAREGTPGQSLAAAGVGSIFAVAAGRSLAPRSHPMGCVAGCIAVAFVGPILGAIFSGGEALAASYPNELFPLARLTAMHWIAGAWLGAPIGATWAASMIENKDKS